RRHARDSRKETRVGVRRNQNPYSGEVGLAHRCRQDNAARVRSISTISQAKAIAERISSPCSRGAAREIFPGEAGRKWDGRNEAGPWKQGRILGKSLSFLQIKRRRPDLRNQVAQNDSSRLSRDRTQTVPRLTSGARQSLCISDRMAQCTRQS